MLLDHVLDGQTGLDVLIDAKKLQLKFNMNINWVLLSSTEDENTINLYKEQSVK